MNRRIIEIEYFRHDSIHSLEVEVNKAIQDGWQPLGPVLPEPYANNDCNFVQTMVRYDP